MKVVLVLLSVTLVVWVTYKSCTLVMELTTHTWPKRQRNSGKRRYKQLLQLLQAQSCLESVRSIGRSVSAHLLVPSACCTRLSLVACPKRNKQERKFWGI